MGQKKSIQDYEAEIKELHAALLDYGDCKSIQEQLQRKLSAWEKLVDITVYRASNEQLPFGEKELGLPVKKMPTKLESGDYQVADYWFYYKTFETEGWLGLICERKGGKTGCADLYGTLAHADNRQNIYEEIDRFYADPRFDMMVIIAECSFKEYLDYTPEFCGKRRNYNHVGMSVEARLATIASLYVKGVPVFFCGTRLRSVQVLVNLKRQYIIKNYDKILGLEKIRATD